MFDIFLIKNVKNDVRYYFNHVYKKAYNYELHKIVKNFCNYMKIENELHRHNYSNCLSLENLNYI